MPLAIGRLLVLHAYGPRAVGSLAKRHPLLLRNERPATRCLRAAACAELRGEYVRVVYVLRPVVPRLWPPGLTFAGVLPGRSPGGVWTVGWTIATQNQRPEKTLLREIGLSSV